MLLLEETLQKLANYHLSENDVLFVTNDDEWCTWEEFKKISDFHYNNGYGFEEINPNLKIVGDTWWLERRATYDGIEWWTYKEVPVLMNEDHNSKMNLLRND